MTTPINRPLTDAERSLINALAIRVVAEQGGTDLETAAAALDTFTEEGQAFLQGNATDVHLVVAGNPIVHVTREWLAFHAEHPEAIDWERHGRLIPRSQDGYDSKD
ncbi:hypothetical protein [Mycolicibacterium sp. GESEQ-9]|uniref:hypothetical protein n=1 Tax=Mycolicibacterium sp. GESEQ-9 TaxID=2812656 RepID=UPI001B335148|nr:hypothetical protein [Mycolicibacterium sp. GESEQ-9]